MRTLSNERAEYALRKIRETQGLDAEFKSFCAGAPALILQNGFVQAMSFWMMKSNGKRDKHRILFDFTAEWLVERRFIDSAASPASVLKQLSGWDRKKYISAQSEALSLLEWIKRFASAFCAGGQE